MSVKVNGEETVDPNRDTFSYFGFEKSIESTDSTITIEFSGSSFSNDGHWSIDLISLAAILPQVSIQNIGPSTIIEDEHEQAWNAETGTYVDGDLKKAKFRVARTGPENFELPVELDWADGADGIADPSADASVKRSVTIPEDKNYVDFEVAINDDPEAEGVERLIGHVAARTEGGKYFANEAAIAGAAIVDNISVSDILVERDPDYAFSNSFLGYDFQAKITIKGENIPAVQINQQIRSSTEITQFNGQLATVADIGISHGSSKANSVLNPANAQNDGWGNDEFKGEYPDWHGMNIDLKSKGGVGFYYDHHTHLLPGSLPADSDGGRYAALVKVSRELHIKLLDSSKMKILDKEASWRFKWSNWGSIWRPDDTPPPPAPVMFGASTNFMGTRRGEFEDIHGISGLVGPTPP